MNSVRRFELLQALQDRLNAVASSPDGGGAEKVKTVIASFEFLVLNTVKKEEDERREWLEERKKNRQNLNTQGNGWAPLLLTLATLLITVAFTYVLDFRIIYMTIHNENMMLD